MIQFILLMLVLFLAVATLAGSQLAAYILAVLTIVGIIIQIAAAIGRL